MELLKGKRAQSFVNRFDKSENTTLLHVYARPSTTNIRAEQDCRCWMAKQDGYNFKIISFNSFCFTCGWLFEDENNIYLRVETRDNSYKILYATKN